MGKGAMDAAELNNYPGGTMGESRRRRTPGRSLTAQGPLSPEQASETTARFASSSSERIPALALPLCCVFTDTDSRLKHANAPAGFTEPRARSSSLASLLRSRRRPGASRHRGGSPWGRGAQAVAPQVRPAVSPPRAASRRSPQPRARRARRPPGPWVHSSAGGWAAGALEAANGGGGRRGEARPSPPPLAG